MIFLAFESERCKLKSKYSILVTTEIKRNSSTFLSQYSYKHSMNIYIYNQFLQRSRNWSREGIFICIHRICIHVNMHLHVLIKAAITERYRSSALKGSLHILDFWVWYSASRCLQIHCLWLAGRVCLAVPSHT